MDKLRGSICKIVSKMLDNPNKYGIYPTTKCYDELEGLFNISDIAGLKKEVERLKDENDRIPFLESLMDSQSALIDEWSKLFKMIQEKFLNFKKENSELKEKFEKIDLDYFELVINSLKHTESCIRENRVSETICIEIEYLLQTLQLLQKEKT